MLIADVARHKLYSYFAKFHATKLLRSCLLVVVGSQYSEPNQSRCFWVF
uniref:Uncharacterized protein n=1 Tax=Leuconostoc citreum TaxID=33964 RepID=A0A098DN45_LEUCI|nr:Protein of unknown function [Leuconostoc citreum]